MENDYRVVDQALETLTTREWRTPSIEQITRKEFTMNKIRRKMSRTNLALLIGGIAVIGAGTAFGAAYAMGAFNGKIVTDDGREYDVQMTETAEGVYEGSSADGHQVKFITEGSDAMKTINLDLESPESGEFTFSMDSADLNQTWTATTEEEAAEDTDQK